MGAKAGNNINDASDDSGPSLKIMQEMSEDSEFTVFENSGSFAARVTKSELQHQTLTLCVYSTESERVRDVEITPNRWWGGRGMLGCDVVQGYFHSIPARRKDLWSKESESQAAEPESNSEQAQVSIKGAMNIEDIAQDPNYVSQHEQDILIAKS